MKYTVARRTTSEIAIDGTYLLTISSETNVENCSTSTNIDWPINLCDI